eukprot:1195406-Prorocentrum_minimum.AAC.4
MHFAPEHSFEAGACARFSELMLLGDLSQDEGEVLGDPRFIDENLIQCGKSGADLDIYDKVDALFQCCTSLRHKFSIYPDFSSHMCCPSLPSKLYDVRYRYNTRPMRITHLHTRLAIYSAKSSFEAPLYHMRSTDVRPKPTRRDLRLLNVWTFVHAEIWKDCDALRRGTRQLPVALQATGEQCEQGALHQGGVPEAPIAPRCRGGRAARGAVPDPNEGERQQLLQARGCRHQRTGHHRVRPDRRGPLFPHSRHKGLPSFRVLNPTSFLSLALHPILLPAALD